MRKFLQIDDTGRLAGSDATMDKKAFGYSLEDCAVFHGRIAALVRLIGKWRNAGVMAEGCIYHPESGVPQGGVVSPILSNVYAQAKCSQKALRLGK